MIITYPVIFKNKPIPLTQHLNTAPAVRGLSAETTTTQLTVYVDNSQSSTGFSWWSAGT
nr:MAG TPA: hypothetical protein [Caudoviricetes sp.]